MSETYKCFLCRNQIVDGEWRFFSCEWDAFIHVVCVKDIDPNNPEARIAREEYLDIGGDFSCLEE